MTKTDNLTGFAVVGGTKAAPFTRSPMKGEPGGDLSNSKSSAFGAPAISIEKGVPPPTRHQRHQGISVVLRALEVGDSFLVPNDNLASVAARMTTVGRKTGRRFVRRKISEKQTRIWRIS